MTDMRKECGAIEQRAKTAGLTVDEVCAAAGINRSTWQRWKAGTTNPKLKDWQRVLAVVPESEAAA